MKKTLIALAVAASAVVSGSAMAAWSINDNINIGGNITALKMSVCSLYKQEVHKYE